MMAMGNSKGIVKRLRIEIIRSQDSYLRNKVHRLSKAYHKRNTYGKKRVEYTSKIVEVVGTTYLVTEYVAKI